MEGIHKILNAIYSSSEEDVLATIIRAEGSAYRKESTSMLFRKDGTKVGMLSAGCNGVIYVLLETLDMCFQDHLSKLKFSLDSGNRVTVIKRLSDDFNVTDYLFIADDHHIFGKWHRGVPPLMKGLISEVHQSVSKSGIRFFPELSSCLYIHSFEPKPRLIVFGAGADAVPLVKLASHAGFLVIVLNWRSALCNVESFLDAEQLIVGFPAETVNKFIFTNLDSVLILTHHFQWDKELLNHLKGKELRYLGVLGSHERTQRLYAGKAIPPEINSPVGLSIRAEGPEEMAISIVAELIQRQRSKKIELVVSS